MEFASQTLKPGYRPRSRKWYCTESENAWASAGGGQNGYLLLPGNWD